MILEEHGLIPEGKNPSRAGITTFSAFIAVGVIPLIPFLVNVVIPGGVSTPFIWSAVLTGFAFFLIGAIKSRFVDASWLYGGLEILGRFTHPRAHRTEVRAFEDMPMLPGIHWSQLPQLHDKIRHRIPDHLITDNVLLQWEPARQQREGIPS